MKPGRPRLPGARYPGGKLKPRPLHVRPDPHAKPAKKQHQADMVLRRFSWEEDDGEG